MLLFNADLLVEDPFAFTVLIVSVLIALLIGITVHEFAHAAAATSRGDFTAQRLGRLTLNPKAHLSPAGTIDHAVDRRLRVGQTGAGRYLQVAGGT
jgi:Zn-dependent protease